MSLYERLRTGLRRAMTDRDRTAMAALRSAIAAIDNAGAVAVEQSSYQVGFSSDVPRRSLTEHDLGRILESELDERRQAISLLSGLAKHAEVERLREEVAVLTAYLASTEDDPIEG